MRKKVIFRFMGLLLPSLVAAILYGCASASAGNKRNPLTLHILVNDKQSLSVEVVIVNNSKFAVRVIDLPEVFPGQFVLSCLKTNQVVVEHRELFLRKQKSWLPKTRTLQPGEVIVASANLADFVDSEAPVITQGWKSVLSKKERIDISCRVFGVTGGSSNVIFDSTSNAVPLR